MEYPNLAICHLHTTKLHNDLFNIDRLEDYIPLNPMVHKAHTHDFYHFAYLTDGSGEHVIDFEQFEAHQNMLYFMKPHQVHQWNFSKDTKGFVINFSATFLDSNFINSAIIQSLPFYQYGRTPQTYTLPFQYQKVITQKLTNLYDEQSNHEVYKHAIIAQKLVEVLLLLGRYLATDTETLLQLNYQQQIVNNFNQLLEQNYHTWKHPKDYAAALNISPQVLQTAVKQCNHVSAGTIIKERILLESKRLLVNKSKSISEIAYALNFSDNSYFTKFFKKYTLLTPEQFRAHI